MNTTQVVVACGETKTIRDFTVTFNPDCLVLKFSFAPKNQSRRNRNRRKNNQQKKEQLKQSQQYDLDRQTEDSQPIEPAVYVTQNDIDTEEEKENEPIKTI